MKIFMYLIANLFYLAYADSENIKESTVASDKSDDFKTKRDASFLSSTYHGPSNRYLPPSTVYSAHNSYPESAGNFMGFPDGLAVGSLYSSEDSGRGHNHKIFTAHAPHYIGSHYGIGFTSANYPAVHKFIKHSGSGFRRGLASHAPGTFGIGGLAISRPHSYTNVHAYDSLGSSGSGVSYKSHSQLGANVDVGSNYHKSKGMIGPFSSPSSFKFGSANELTNSFRSDMYEENHRDHVHNGEQEHIYVIPNISSSFSNIHDVTFDQQSSNMVPNSSHLFPIKQHALPSTINGEQISNVADSYNTNYLFETNEAIKHRPAYAAGYKGLGYFSFISNNPKVIHPSISEINRKQTYYSKAPFKPSTFLGAKFEGLAHNEASSQQHLSLFDIDNDTTGNYQEPSYQQSTQVKQNSVRELDSSYWSPTSNESSFDKVSPTSTNIYLPPSNIYGVPFSH